MSLFDSLVDPQAPSPRPARLGPTFSSLAAHAALGALLLLAPGLRTGSEPPARAPVPVLYFDSPPPPPLPPPPGRADGRRDATEVRPQPPQEVPAEPPRDVFAAWRQQVVEFLPEEHEDPWGDPEGDAFGVPEGMPGGSLLGQVGGLPGGRPGGVIGGSGDGPVRDYDRGPRLLEQTRPEYPHPAFVKRVQGTVLLEIVIGRSGRVEQARVIESVPALDAAAIACVRQWRFEPAVKDGRPVASLARTPIHFWIR